MWNQDKPLGREKKMDKDFVQMHYKREYPNSQSTYEKVLTRRANVKRTGKY